jgi:hypothetical protein
MSRGRLTMENQTLEQLLDVRAHAERCAEWIWSMGCYTLREIRQCIRYLVPDFPLRDESNQRIWADVIAARAKLNPDIMAPRAMTVQDELIEVYQDYLRTLDEEDKEAARAPYKTWVFWRLPSGQPEQEPANTICPAYLAQYCASLERDGMFDARFYITGRGRMIRGNAMGWTEGCQCGLWMCHRHGVPQKNRPEWHAYYDPELWPYVGIVPGAMHWHSVPPLPWHTIP